LSAIVGLLSGPYRQSYRQVCELMEVVFGVRLSRGSVGRLRDELSAALAAPVSEAKVYVQSQPRMHSDETSFPQGNRDGQNPQKTQGWLWVLVTPFVSFFEVVLSRSQETAKAFFTRLATLPKLISPKAFNKSLLRLVDPITLHINKSTNTLVRRDRPPPPLPTKSLQCLSGAIALHEGSYAIAVSLAFNC
jgi:hypothetical protein